MTEVDMPKDPYARIAPRYDRLLEGFNAPLRAISLRMLPPTAGMKVLDVGCGTGANLVPYVEAGCEAFGLDASDAMLSQARKRLGERAQLILCDASSMAYDDGMFDLVRASMFLHELPPNVAGDVIREMVRVTTPGGSLVLVDFATKGLTLKGRGLRVISMIAERIAGREHHRNCRAYLGARGIPGLTVASPLTEVGSRVVGGGNMGIYVFTKGKGPQPS